MHIGRDGVWREHVAGTATPEPAPLAARESDTALMRYFDRPRPVNDRRRVYRSVHSGARYTGYNSTSFRYVDVSLPRVSLLDGAFGGAANDNRKETTRNVQHHAAA